MRRATLILTLTFGTLACGRDPVPTTPSQAGPTPTASPAPPPSGSGAQLELSVNGQRTGTFPCSRDGIFLEARLRNLSSAPERLERLEVLFEPTLGACQAMTAPIDPALGLVVGAGQSALVRRFDAAGQLCQPPQGAAGCGWVATARVTTASAATLEDAIAFVTHDAPPFCDGIVSRVGSPSAGAVLSGVVDVVGAVVEGGGCVMSARAIVEGYSAAGDLVFRTPPQDLGDRYRWDTRRVPNGPYHLTAYQNCCQIRSLPIEVSVSN